MKKTSLSITALALMALTLVTSCQKDSPLIPFVPGDQVRFSVGSAGAGTKAVYSGAGTSTIERIDWQKNDLIRIYCAQASGPECNYADYAVTKASASGAISEADIAATDGVGLCWGAGLHTFYGVYPSPDAPGSIATSISGAAVQASLPAGQGVIGGITKSGSAWTAAPDLKNMLMTAKSAEYDPATGIPDGTVLLGFTPLTTAIKFTIKNGTGDELKLTQVQLISGNGKTSAEPVISGAFSVNMDATGITAGTVVQPFTDSDFKITYSRDYPQCTAVKTSSDDQAADRTLTISVGTDEKPLKMAVNETLTFTFFLTPVHDFSDLTFRLVKAGGSWMSTRLGYTDGNGIFFPRHMKSTVAGLLVPKGAQWRVSFGDDLMVYPWDELGELNDIDLNYPEGETVTLMTVWDKGIEEEPTFRQELLSGKFSVSATEYAQFSIGNLFCRDNGESASPRYTFDLEKNQYTFHTRYGLTHYSDAGITQISNPSTIPGIIYKENESGFFQWVSENAAIKTSDETAFKEAEASFGAFSSLPFGDCTGQLTDEVDFGKAYGDGAAWTTLTEQKFTYLISGRPNAANLLNKVVTVNGVKGMVIAPDDWNFAAFPIVGTGAPASYAGDAWTEAEAKGLVFLPAARCYNREEDPDGVRSCGAFGDYWSKTPGPANAFDACYMYFAYGNSDPEKIGTYPNKRSMGLSVRLVQTFDKPTYNVTYSLNGGVSGDAPVDGTSYPEGSSATVLAPACTPTKDGVYAFIRWNTEADGSGMTYYPGDLFTLTGNVTLYAQYGSTLTRGDYFNTAIGNARTVVFGNYNTYSETVGAWETGTDTSDGSNGSIRVFKLNDGSNVYVLSRGVISLGTSCRDMFQGKSNLNSINFGGNVIDTRRVEQFGVMFAGCSNLTFLDLSDFDTRGATGGVNDNGRLFENCSKLVTICVGERWDLYTRPNSSDNAQCFSGCSSLVGGNGTAYSDSHKGIDYARIDGQDGNPGYLTFRTAKAM